jgi:hypothetical protein
MAASLHLYIPRAASERLTCERSELTQLARRARRSLGRSVDRECGLLTRAVPAAFGRPVFILRWKQNPRVLACVLYNLGSRVMAMISGCHCERVDIHIC